MPIYLERRLGCERGNPKLSGARSARSRLMRSRLLSAAVPTSGLHYRAPIVKWTPPVSASSLTQTSPTPISTSRTWRSTRRKTNQAYQSWATSQAAGSDTSYAAYQASIEQQGAASPSTAYGSTVENWDASGNPVYAVAPAGESVIGYDAQSNPVYGPGSALAAPAASASPGTTTVDTSASGYQSILDWFTDPNQELISGVQNWMIVVAAGGVWLFLSRRKGGR